jgi:hypothetical protein
LTSSTARVAAGNGAASDENGFQALYERAESETARALEGMVATPSFGRLLGATAENIAALNRIGSDLADLVLRNLRVAGRADIVRLARQLHRTEDKLELVLQEIETLRDDLRATSATDVTTVTSSTDKNEP